MSLLIRRGIEAVYHQALAQIFASLDLPLLRSTLAQIYSCSKLRFASGVVNHPPLSKSTCQEAFCSPACYLTMPRGSFSDWWMSSKFVVCREAKLRWLRRQVYHSNLSFTEQVGKFTADQRKRRQVYCNQFFSGFQVGVFITLLLSRLSWVCLLYCCTFRDGVDIEICWRGGVR